MTRERGKRRKEGRGEEEVSAFSCSYYSMIQNRLKTNYARKFKSGCSSCSFFKVVLSLFCSNNFVILVMWKSVLTA